MPAAERLRGGLERLVTEFPSLFEAVRGAGLLLGVKCRRPVREVAWAARDQRLLTVVAGDEVLRILPPLIVTDDEIDEGLDRLRKAAAGLTGRSRLHVQFEG